jgi:hypothetical protein
VKSAAPPAVDARPVLAIKAPFPEVGERRPLGWIYVYDDVRGRKDRCVYIWSDRTWSLAEETSPGYFGDRVASGCIGTPSGDAGMAPALDFPEDALEGWRDVYVAGNVSAAYKGQVIPRGS